MWILTSTIWSPNQKFDTEIIETLSSVPIFFLCYSVAHLICCFFLFKQKSKVQRELKRDLSLLFLNLTNTTELIYIYTCVYVCLNFMEEVLPNFSNSNTTPYQKKYTQIHQLIKIYIYIRFKTAHQWSPT